MILSNRGVNAANPGAVPTGVPRVRWSVVGTDDSHEGRIEGLGDRRAWLVTSEPAPEDAKLELALLDASGRAVAVGLARVDSVDPQIGPRIEILALGLDATLLEALARAPASPPPLPSRRQHDAAQPETAGEEEEFLGELEELPVRTSGIVIGIDLGTTNTCASYVKDGRTQVIPSRTGAATIPSMITFEPDGSFHIGQRAADRQVLHPSRTVYGTKRLLGRTYRPDLAAEMQRHFAYPLAEAEGQRFGVRIDDRVISMDTIAARVLDEVRSCAEAHLGARIESAVITVPAYFSEVQREAVRRAAAQAGLAVHRIVNEPTAAAVAYGHKQDAPARVAVWDFGGGTFDFSIVDVARGRLEVIATGGDNFVGGSDVDDLIASHLLAEFVRVEGVELEPTAQQIARLREAGEHAKRVLSEQTEILVELPELTRQPRRDLRIELTRERVEALIQPLIERTVAIASEVMESCGLAPSAIDDVILVGGSTRVPAVQRAVGTLFGRRPSKRINPDEAVALGAALVAAEIGGTGPKLLDILPMSVGRAGAMRRFEPIAARYTRLPSRHELQVDADILGSVHVPLFQGESPDAAKNEYLCSVIVEDRSLWDGGRVVLRLSFDEHCVMVVDARDARSGRALAVTLDRSRPVEDVLRELGAPPRDAPPDPKDWKLPETRLGQVLGKLFRVFGRGRA